MNPASLSVEQDDFDYAPFNRRGRVSVHNRKLMTQFFREYPNFCAIGQSPAGQLAAEPGDALIWQRVVAKLTWAHNVTRALPKKLQSALPSIAQIEAELSAPAATRSAKQGEEEKRR